MIFEPKMTIQLWFQFTQKKESFVQFVKKYLKVTQTKVHSEFTFELSTLTSRTLFATSAAGSSLRTALERDTCRSVLYPHLPRIYRHLPRSLGESKKAVVNRGFGCLCMLSPICGKGNGRCKSGFYCTNFNKMWFMKYRVCEIVISKII